MPVSIKRNPFKPAAPPVAPPTAMRAPTKPGLRIPQARVVKALMPDYPDDPRSEWPLLNRAVLGIKAGYTAISGTITRALNGIHEGSSSGDPHPGLITRGLVEVVEVDVEGVRETSYRITAAGIAEYTSHVASNGEALPQVRDATLCTNERYSENKP